MQPNVIGSVQVLPHTASGMKETPVAMIEWKVPSFGFTDRRVQRSYFEAATGA